MDRHQEILTHTAATGISKNARNGDIKGEGSMQIQSGRRDFIAGATALGATALIYSGQRGYAQDARSQLLIPPELFADADGTIRLVAQSGSVKFGARPQTATYGINGNFLGPAVRVKRGDDVVMHVKNDLPEPTTMHWHGLVIPGHVDGGPHQIMAPGESWTAPLSIDQPAATLWFHPHMYPATAEQVIKGLAGLLLVDDDESSTLGLPDTWGVDDIPLILQDRRFEANGDFFHRFNLAAVTVGYVGDTALVNGAEYPVAKTARAWLRLRVLNGSNARSYRLTASDDRPMFVIGSDGGLLAHPVQLTELTVHAGERYEVLVDARNGEAFDLLTLPLDQPVMRLPPFDVALPLVTIDPSGPAGGGNLPDRLATLPALPSMPPPISQTLTMNMNRDKEGMKALMDAGLMAVSKGTANAADIGTLTDLLVKGPKLSKADQLSANGVNGASFRLDAQPFKVKQNTSLRWRIDENSDTMLHPVHVHGCQFRVLTLDGAAPPAYLSGWKDTVAIAKGGSAEILVRFPHSAEPTSPYMAHCHILEHEDSGMMAQFTVG